MDCYHTSTYNWKPCASRQRGLRGAERDACQGAKGAKYFEVTGVLWKDHRESS